MTDESEHLSATDLLDQQLSAFLDGELPAHEAELLIRRLSREPRLQQSLSRYALIGEIVRTPKGGNGVLASGKFVGRVREALAGDRAPARWTRWVRPAAGMSIAAGVAAVAVILAGQGPAVGSLPADALSVDVAPATPQPLQARQAAAGEVPGPVEEVSYIVPEIAVTGPLVPAARLTNYVMAHSEYTSPLGRRNVLSGMLADEVVPADGEASAVLPAEFVPMESGAAR